MKNSSILHCIEERQFGSYDTQSIQMRISGLPAFIDRDELCQWLHISKSSLHHYMRLNVIPHYKMGRRTLFKVAEIENILQKINY